MNDHGIVIEELETKLVKYKSDSLNAIQGALIELFFDFGFISEIIGEKSATRFLVRPNTIIKDRLGKVYVDLKTSTEFIITNFDESPNIVYLEECVHMALKKHYVDFKDKTKGTRVGGIPIASGLDQDSLLQQLEAAKRDQYKRGLN